MKTILAIETSTDIASVALFHQGVLKTTQLSGVNTHSHGLLPAIDDLLSEFAIDVSQIERLAFGCGPGAFTGVRTACGVVQGLAFALDLPVLPLVSLHVQAQAAREQHGIDECVCLLDARMSEVYWTHLKWDGSAWQEVTVANLSTLPELMPYLSQQVCPIVFGSNIPFEGETNLKSLHAMPHAAQAISLAMHAPDSACVRAEDAQPLYLRNKVALTTAERLLAARRTNAALV